MDWPLAADLNGPTICSWEVFKAIPPYFAGGGSTLFSKAATVWPTANTAMFIPFVVNAPIVVTKIWAANGGAVSGNIDVGIYDENGTKLVSAGSTAQAGTSVAQAFDITDTQLGRGRFYMAYAKDSTSGTLESMYMATGAAGHFYSACGILIQASAFALPATATFAQANATDVYVPLMGLLVSPRTVV